MISCTTCVVIYAPIISSQNYLADKKRGKKKKPRAKHGDETAKMEDKETENKQEVESGAEEPAAEAVVKEDEGINHCLLHLFHYLFLTNAVDNNDMYYCFIVDCC